MDYLLFGVCSHDEKQAVKEYYQRYCQHKAIPHEMIRVDRGQFMRSTTFQDLDISFKKGCRLVLYRPANVVTSLKSMLLLWAALARQGIELHVVRWDMALPAEMPLLAAINICGLLDHDFISFRTKTLLAKRRKAGLPLGRPKGKPNRSLILDKHHDQIIQYLRLGVNKASIAKLVDCHPQTLHDWLRKRKAVVERDLMNTATA